MLFTVTNQCSSFREGVFYTDGSLIIPEFVSRSQPLWQVIPAQIRDLSDLLEVRDHQPQLSTNVTVWMVKLEGGNLPSSPFQQLFS